MLVVTTLRCCIESRAYLPRKTGWLWLGLGNMNGGIRISPFLLLLMCMLKTPIILMPFFLSSVE